MRNAPCIIAILWVVLTFGSPHRQAHANHAIYPKTYSDSVDGLIIKQFAGLNGRVGQEVGNGRTLKDTENFQLIRELESDPSYSEMKPSLMYDQSSGKGHLSKGRKSAANAMEKRIQKRHIKKSKKTKKSKKRGSKDRIVNAMLGTVTFNVGLHPTVVPEYETRRAKFIEIIENGSLPGDVVCLQEVWEADDLREIISKTRTDFPFSVSALHQTIDGDTVFPTANPSIPACTLAEVNAVSQCFFNNCLANNATDLFLCFVGNCVPEYQALSQVCLACLLARQSRNPKELLASFNRTEFCATTPYEVTYGLVILSKRPIEDASFVDYHEGYSVSVPRGYLRAKVSDIHVFCTHTTPVLTDVYIDGRFSSYAEQSLYELGTLLNAANPDLERSLLLGDFNTSPSIPDANITSQLPLSYDLLVQNYFSPYLETVTLCTFCYDNWLTYNLSNVIIDHVLVPKSWRDLIMAKATPLRIFDGDDTVSDHYGVALFSQENQEE
ncbi:uncharacterized protein LOC106164300 isoform X2 [Lingula anatina]|uniref:Uncharacterized protein LOC106164300 isoform X2 n=1 Tax=Lingula anatina TaxID=7574 RepID=A0A1S3IIC8_LINAN|nr:uncharacterized protein LOC106164300 isoform X2 [Lingula anatina]|eukprot:XP_013397636.1 uncharacterized protein LOC106164300 isoform X2 [Lingula anatina]